MSRSSSSKVTRPGNQHKASDRGRSRLGDVTRPIHIDRRLTKQRRTNVLLAVVAIAIAGALAAALFVLPVQTYFGQNDKLDQRSDQLAQIETVVADLRAEVNRLKTDDGVREAAREELGMVEAGEMRESILDLPEVPTQLPIGWPYSMVTAITDLRRNPPAPTTQQP